MNANYATDYLRATNQTVNDFDGACGDLADKVIGPNDHILHVAPTCFWRYHMVPFINGLVHDAWCSGDAMAIKDWLVQWCSNEVITLALDGEDIYHGRASDFDEANIPALVALREPPTMQCPSCHGSGEWETECCNGSGGCSCRGQVVPMGRCNVCGGCGQVPQDISEEQRKANCRAISGLCFVGSGPSSGIWANQGARGNFV